MRITSEILLKLANDFTAQRAKTGHDVLAVYMHGSLLTESPVLGGTADIDLFIVHISDFENEREIVRITDDIHYDVAHSSRDAYRHAKELRLHPWLGPMIQSCKILYDPQHFMDFTQASVRGQFNRPDNVVGRAEVQAGHAREIWLGYQQEFHEPGPEDFARYLRAVSHAANALASLSGPPLTDRRFLQHFPEKAVAAGRPGLSAGLLGLLGGPQARPETLRTWLVDWLAAYQALPSEGVSARLHPHRLRYYLRAFEAFLDWEGQHQLLLWPLLRTWTEMVCALPPDSVHRAAWQEAGNQLGLLGPAFTERLAALDSYLDTVEEALDEWARKQGA